MLVVSYTTVSPLPGGVRQAVCFLWHCPAGRPGLPLATTLPYGVRTFLDESPRRDRPADSSAGLRVAPLVTVDTLDSVMNDREEVTITRVGHESSLTDSLAGDELEATAYLLRSQENARRLAAAIERLEACDGTRQEPATASKASAPPDR